MPNTQPTYKKHVQEVTSYGWRPMDYDVWLSWRVNKRIKDLTEEDRAKHPKES